MQVLLLPGRISIDAGAHSQEWLAPDLNYARRLNDGSVMLQNGPWHLDVQEPGFDRALEHYLGKKLFRRSFFDKIGLAGCLIALLLILLPLLAAFLWLAPALAEGAAGKVSPEVEKQIGDAWYRNLTSQYRVDSLKTRLAQEFYDSLHYNSRYPIKITVVREPVVNAFALPGGGIVVFDSIIGIMDAPEQLAALLAHEASHVELRHSTRAVFRQLANHLLLSLIFGDDGSISGIVGQQSSELAGLSYSRSLELEADQHGLEYLKKSRIPLRGMSDLFRKMNAGTKSQPDVPNFLSTHPGLEERIHRAETFAREQGPEAAKSVPASFQQIWIALQSR